MPTNALTHWKTTANGILAFLIATLTILSGFFGTQDTVNGGVLHAHTWVPVAVTIALALCRAWVGLLQQDAGSTPAIVPGSATPQLVASHEVPNDPAAVPVVSPKP